MIFVDTDITPQNLKMGSKYKDIDTNIVWEWNGVKWIESEE